MKRIKNHRIFSKLDYTKFSYYLLYFENFEEFQDCRPGMEVKDLTTH